MKWDEYMRMAVHQATTATMVQFGAKFLYQPQYVVAGYISNCDFMRKTASTREPYTDDPEDQHPR